MYFDNLNMFTILPTILAKVGKRAGLRTIPKARILALIKLGRLDSLIQQVHSTLRNQENNIFYICTGNLVNIPKNFCI